MNNYGINTPFNLKPTASHTGFRHIFNGIDKCGGPRSGMPWA